MTNVKIHPTRKADLIRAFIVHMRVNALSAHDMAAYFADEIIKLEQQLVDASQLRSTLVELHNYELDTNRDYRYDPNHELKSRIDKLIQKTEYLKPKQ